MCKYGIDQCYDCPLLMYCLAPDLAKLLAKKTSFMPF
jgi:hypothetical protein